MIKMMRLLILWFIGGLLYELCEILFRGYSHWTMFIIGGFCFLCIGGINEIIPWNMSILLQGLIGSIVVTLIEFLSGIILNIWMGWNIWDYSNLPFNLLGQICLLFSIVWFFVSLAAIILDDYLRYWLFDEEKPAYILF